MSEDEHPIEQALSANDEAFLIISADGEHYEVALHGSSEDGKSPEIVQFQAPTIALALTKLEHWIARQVDLSFGNAFWNFMQEKEDDE